MRPQNIIPAVLGAAVLIHRLTGRLNAFVVLTALAFLVWLIVSTWGDGRRAMRVCAEESEVDSDD